MSSGRSTVRQPLLRYIADFSRFRLVVERRSDGWYILGSDRERNFPLYYSACLSLETAKQEAAAWVARQAGEQPRQLDWREE